MKCALYHRVSTTDQDVTLARKELTQFAQMRNLEVVLDIEETGSGARNDRPGLQTILQAARKGQIQTVVCYKLDRFGRSTIDLLTNIKALQHAGVTFEVSSQGITILPKSDPTSTLLLTMLAAVSEFERTLIIERTVLGLQKARERGQVLGRPIDPKAPTKAKVEELRASGKSWTQVSKELGCNASAARRAIAR